MSRWSAGLLAAAVFGLGAAPAALGHACDRTDNDRAQASRVISRMTGEIDVMEATIADALRRQTGQLSGYQAQSAKALTHALDAKTQLEARIAREVEESRSQRAHRPSESACRAISGLRGLGATRAAARAALERAVEAETARLQGESGAAADNVIRFGIVTRRYCNAERQGSGACAGEAARHGVDLKAASLFDQRTFDDEAALHDAIEVSRNLAAPVVNPPLPYASADTEPEQRRILLGRAADGRAALAADYFAHARALRMPGAALGAWAAAVAAPGTASDASARSAATSCWRRWRAGGSRIRTGSSGSRR